MKQTNLTKYISSSSLQSLLVAALPTLLPSIKVKRVEHGSIAHPGLFLHVVTPVGRQHRLALLLQATAIPSRIRESLRRWRSSLPKGEAYPMVASTFLSPRVREICREENVGYVDVAGNCRIALPDVYLEKVVDRNPFPKRGRPATVFAPVSSRVIRALLEEPARAWAVIEVATTAGVSLGQASNVCRRLIDDAYAIRRDRRLTLTEPGKLLEAWQDRYDPARHEAAVYYSFEREPQALMRRLAEVAKARQWRYAVTGLAGAALIAPFVHGAGTVSWYVPDALARAQWVDALDLRPVEDGANAVMLIPRDRGVWHRAQTADGVAVVGSIQLYLDLWSDPGRGREQAEFLRQQTLKI